MLRVTHDVDGGFDVFDEVSNENGPENAFNVVVEKVEKIIVRRSYTLENNIKMNLIWTWYQGMGCVCVCFS